MNFIFHCLSFSLIGERKGEQLLLKRCLYNYCNGLYLLHHANHQIHVLKLLRNEHDFFAILIQVSKDGFVLRLICVFLFSNAAAAKIIIMLEQYAYRFFYL